jgi:hypothetical protein
MIMSGKNVLKLPGKICLHNQIPVDRFQSAPILHPAILSNHQMGGPLRRYVTGKCLIHQQASLNHPGIILTKPPEQKTIDQPDLI